MSSLGPTFGAAFIGLIASAVMYGLTLLQTFHYYRGYPRDPSPLKWLLQTDASTTVALGVQLYFARRVYQLSKNKLLTAVIVAFAIIHFALGIYFTVESFIVKSFAAYKNFIWVTCVGLGSAAVADILIAVSMCYFLRKNRTGFAKTDTLITTLMTYSINTGLMTSVIASTSVILYSAMPNNLVWISVFWMLGKLYINSFLAMLNSRESLREIVHPSDGSVVQLSNIGRESYVAKRAYRYTTDARKARPPLEVSVQMSTEERIDYIPSMKDSKDKAHDVA
ncbi:hypothetical protein BD410DRAFT_806057 [Rickenella mellea]|uniref:DUF6534 domain-containing protein n=1 Tax=Rickenella mellea TaxID=50990 RepID=A0A4Y7PUN4_9AGAM|nr:hypothetical protein BD410DRAFT_806057 [Rickenella mellea]